MSSTQVSEQTVPTATLKRREEVPQGYTWNLSDIFSGWADWESAFQALDAKIDSYQEFKGTLAQHPERLLAAYRSADDIGQLAYKVWYYPSLWYDQDQRDNEIDARRQRVQILLAKWKQASSWFNPELLEIPHEQAREWLSPNSELQTYRFAIEETYRQQEHVLDEAGERLLSLSSRLSAAPTDAFWALSTADAKFPAITLSDGRTETLTYGRYRAILSTERNQADRAHAFRVLHEFYGASQNTYAALYNGVCQRDWFVARARGYGSTLEAALHTDNIPRAVVMNLIETTRGGTEPLRRYQRLRKRLLGVERYYIYDATVSLLDASRKHDYDTSLEQVVDSVAPLGAEYQARMRRAASTRWIDVYENEGKRSGAYSAAVYGVHPYMLLNYNDTLDSVFTLAHEMGHSMHTLLAQETQPFVYSNYTIFVAEVPSTLSEALLLEHLLERTEDPAFRALLLQHAIDGIAGTFYAQVLFADYELQVHRLVERGRPITADVLSGIYRDLLQAYYGDTFEEEPLSRLAWARIPHFFSSPYYVYQYATCFASAAKLSKEIMHGSPAVREDARERFLTLLKAGGSDHPMELLRRAGVDLGQPETVRAVVDQLDDLVGRLEKEIDRI